MVDEYCEGCYYRAFFPALGWGCEYLVMTEKRRPCPSGNGCTVRRLKSREGTHNADQRKKAMVLEAMTDEEREAHRLRQLEKKRIRNHEYYHSHKQELSQKAKIKLIAQKNYPWTIGAHARKRITAANTKAFWQGRQSKAIKDWKLAHGLTYEQMAELLEVETSTVLMWVYENNTANWDKLQKIGIEKPYISPKTDATIDKPDRNDKI